MDWAQGSSKTHLVHLLGRYCNSPLPGVERVSALLERAKSEHVERSYAPRPTSRARRLSKVEINALVALYRQTKNMRAVARQLSLSRETVAKYLREAGVVTSNRMSEAQVSLAIRLYEQGLSSMVIGSRLGFDNHTILAALRDADVSIRGPLGR